MQTQYIVDYYRKKLVGRTVVDIVGVQESDNEDDKVMGLMLDNGSVAWVLCDPEGNGPGFLEVQEQK